jgi:hypothetical protein
MLKYILVGRRQPAHQGHIEQIKDVINKGGMPILFIGSINEKNSEYYNPALNPLNKEQSVRQLEIILEKENVTNYKIITIEDVGNSQIWTENLIKKLQEEFSNYNPQEFRFHYFPKKHQNGAVDSLEKCAEIFQKKGIEPNIFLGTKEGRNLHSSHFRQIPINSAEFQILPAAEYLTKISGSCATLQDLSTL